MGGCIVGSSGGYTGVGERKWGRQDSSAHPHMPPVDTSFHIVPVISSSWALTWSHSPTTGHTLHHTPGVLPGLRHLVANLHLFGTANHCKWEMDLPGDTEVNGYHTALSRAPDPITREGPLSSTARDKVMKG